MPRHPDDRDRRAQRGPGTRPADRSRAPQAELTRLRAEAGYHQRLRDLTVSFSRDVSSTLTLATALEAFAFDANGHARGAPHLDLAPRPPRPRAALSARSAPDARRSAARVATDDRDAPPPAGCGSIAPWWSPGGDSEMLSRPCAAGAAPSARLSSTGPFTGELDRRAAPRSDPRARPAAVGRHRERPAARGHPAPAPAARRHVQLAGRSRRRHRQRAARRPDERRVHHPGRRCREPS